MSGQMSPGKMILILMKFQSRAYVSQSTAKATVIRSCLRYQSIDRACGVALRWRYDGGGTDSGLQGSCMGSRSGYVQSERHDHQNGPQIGIVHQQFDAGQSVQNESSGVQ